MKPPTGRSGQKQAAENDKDKSIPTANYLTK
jgi:hypothetical protein